MDGLHEDQSRQVIDLGGRRGHEPRRAELKKGRKALFQQPVRAA